MENQTAVPLCEYNSIFVSEIKINLANYLTELLIKNFCEWQKKPLPCSPFWRKDIQKNADKSLIELANRYRIELPAVKNLLVLFAPKVISTYFIENRVVGMKMVKKETQQRILYDLCRAQVKYVRSLEGVNKRDLETVIDKRTFVETQTGATQRGKLGKL